MNNSDAATLSKKIIKNTIFNIFGSSFGLLITILLTPFIVRKLGLLQFGILAIVNVFVTHINLLDFGIKTSLVKYLAGLYQKKDFININRLVNTGLVFCAGSALIVAVLGLILAEQFLAFFRISTPFVGDALVAFRLAIISFFIANLGAVFVATQIGLQRMDTVNKAKIASSFLYTLGAVFFLQAGFGLRGLMFGRLISSVTESVLNVLMTFKILPLLKLSFSLVNKKTLARLFNFGIKVQVGELANVVRSYIGNFLVARYLGVELSGFYEIATRIVNQVGVFPPMIISAVLPAVSELHSQKDNKKLYRLYWQGTKYLSLLAIPMVVFVFVLAPLIIQAWLGSGFEKTVPVLRLMILGLGLTFFTGLPTLFFQGTGEVQYTMYGAFVALLLHIFLGFVFVIKFGFIGPAWGVFISVLLAVIFYLILFHKKTGWPLIPVIVKLVLPLLIINIASLSLIYIFKAVFWSLFLNRAWQVTILGIEFLVVVGINLLVVWKTDYLDSKDKRLFLNYILLLRDKLLGTQKTPRWEGPRDGMERVHSRMLHGRVFYEHYRRYQFATRFVRGKKVLDAACGTGYGSELFAYKAKEVVGVDYDLETIKQCQQDYQRSNLGFIHGDVTRLNFPEDNFDVIVSFETLEHVKDFRKCLFEFKRVLKPEGILLLSVPNQKFDNFNNPHHINKFSQQRLREELTRYFKEVKILGQRYAVKKKVPIIKSAPLVNRPLARYLYSFFDNVFFSFFPKIYEKLRRYLYLRKIVITENYLDRAETFLVVCKN